MRLTRILAFAVPVVALLWFIRDPAWLADYTEGLRRIEADADGAYRWTDGHASLYVPSTWQVTELELSGFETYRTQASIYVDGRLAGRLLVDERWLTVPVATGATPTGRRHRRIDILIARTSDDQRGVRLRWPVKEETGFPR